MTIFLYNKCSFSDYLTLKIMTIKAMLPVIIAVLLANIAYDMFIKKALKIDSFEEDFDYEY